MWKNILYRLKQIFCRHTDWRILVPRKITVTQTGNVITGNGSTTDQFRSDFYRMLAAFRSFQTADDTSPRKEFHPIECRRCGKVIFGEVE